LNDYEVVARYHRALAKIRVIHEAPCTVCLHARTCASEPVACESFYRYHKQGFALRRKGVRPTRRWYRKLFAD
jgi:hypothetical protein